MNRFIPALAAACFSLAAVMAHAQTPPAGDRAQMKERMNAAHEACKDKPDRRACMTEQVCAKAQDPAKCREHAKERQTRWSKRMDERQAAAEACTGKRGDELMKCLHAQREKSGRDRPAKK